MAGNIMSKRGTVPEKPQRERIVDTSDKSIKPSQRLIVERIVRATSDTEQSFDFWLQVRQGLLTILDAIEREKGYDPRTSELRRKFKNGEL